MSCVKSKAVLAIYTPAIMNLPMLDFLATAHCTTASDTSLELVKSREND